MRPSLNTPASQAFSECSKYWHVDFVKNHEKTAKTHSDFGGLQSADAGFLLFV